MKLIYIYILRFWKYIQKGKACSPEEYTFILGRLASLVCMQNAQRGGVFHSATLDEFKSREKGDQKGIKDRISWFQSILIHHVEYLCDIKSYNFQM